MITLYFSASLSHAKLSKHNDAPKHTNVKILNWWSYLDDRVASDLKNNGFNLDVSIYHSNEVSLSRLLSKREHFDIAIVSNINLDILLKENIFDTHALDQLSKKRNYIELITKGSTCIPYLWGTTIFAYDSRVSTPPPRSLSALVEMKKNGFAIGILDDPLETAARLIGDNLEDCGNKNLEKIFSQTKNCKDKLSEKFNIGLTPSDFMSTTDEFITKPKTAIYGWQGSVFINLKNAPWLKFNLSSQHPVIGADYVCILKNRANKTTNINQLKKFVEILTNHKNTKANVESNQYFSPYQNDKEGLDPKVISLFDELIELSKKTKPIYINTPTPEEHKELNTWWKKIRYN